MLFFYRTFIVGFLLSLSLSAWGLSEHIERINWAEWPEYENGRNIIALKQIASIVEKFEESEKLTIEIRYPDGEAGRQWAESLSAWFVTFGIPSKYQKLLLEFGSGDGIVIALIDRR